MDKPWTERGSARNITGAWPKAAEATRDHPDEVLRVIDRVLFDEAYRRHRKADDALAKAEVCRLYVRHTKGGTCHVVALVGMWGEPYTVRYSTASGCGYDKRAAAMAGIPAGLDRDSLKGVRPDPVIFTDHCGRDRTTPNEVHPTFREFTLDRLPSHLFVVR